MSEETLDIEKEKLKKILAPEMEGLARRTQVWLNKLLENPNEKFSVNFLDELVRAYKKGRERGLEEVEISLDSFEKMYTTNSAWNGFKWSPETETKMLEAVSKLQCKIGSLKAKGGTEHIRE